ncbi:hypothetical protein OXPF_37570 [Oxobacter pfennigii]|uniref:Uncharacterized protein n=1 Tax=Oxobacter pfennigii TaxID=36849 RepID=A0A0P8Y7Y3_9CLOT|nr:hypothetical protein [Oxobacter pfennigii]KPU42703.1 hypothetical protein OXPF_37570 [Oxobacter pfennigii]
MDWIDYRDKLGIGFSDIEKFQYLKQKVFNILEAIEENSESLEYLGFCNMTGAEINTYYLDDYRESERYDHIIRIIKSHSDTIKKFCLYYIAFVNTRGDKEYRKWGKIEFYNLIVKSLKESHIQFEVLQDGQSYFIFPKGAEELDDGLVSEPLMWLAEYPKAQRTYINALMQYSDGIYIRDVADNFRKALEEFLQEFLENSKNLESNISETGKYLKEHGAEKEISDVLVKLIDSYKKLNDKIAKHNDKVDKKFLEFLMYQTGVFIRMLIVVKNSDSDDL